MKANRFSLLFLITSSVLLFQLGCEEQAAVPQRLDSDWFNQPIWPNQPTAKTIVTPAIAVPQKTPRLTFEKLVYDFGSVSPESIHVCEFRFKNTGDGVLKITDVNNTCGCTPFVLEKKEYAPGESGTLRVGYYADTQLGNAAKLLYVYSNDQTNPRLELSIRSTITAKVDYEPKTLNLVLMRQNGDCPNITIKSLDNQPFSITSFKSTSNCVTADFDPSVRTTEFVLQPKVNMEILANISRGRFEIGISHPDCDLISGTFSAPPRFSTSPKSVTVYNASPGQSTVRTIRLTSNYNEGLEIESVQSRNNIVNVINRKQIQNGYELEVSVKPPSGNSKSRVFTDVLSVNLKGAGQIEIPCNGFYTSVKNAPTSQTSTDDSEECDTCQPIIFY